MQISVDGFVAGPNGELDWMTWDHDPALERFVNELTDSSDIILMGRKMTDEFMNYWENVKPDSAEFTFARKMIDLPKVVFTKTLDRSRWTNTVLAKGHIVDEVNTLKKKPGKDMLVYGGAGFVSSLVKEKLIDEFNLFVNPTLIGKGMRIFDLLEGRQPLKHIGTETFSVGITVLRYSKNG